MINEKIMSTKRIASLNEPSQFLVKPFPILITQIRELALP